MRDGSPKGCLRRGGLINMNELMVLSAICERVNALLINFKPLTGRKLCAGLIFHFLRFHHGQCHNHSLLISFSVCRSTVAKGRCNVARLSQVLFDFVTTDHHAMHGIRPIGQPQGALT